MRHYSPIESSIKIIGYLELILKKPGKLFYELNNRPKALHYITISFLCTLFFCMYGIVVGSFAGGQQYWIAPVKIITGLYMSALICLPSLYIFASLDQAKIGFISIIGNLLVCLNLVGILLIGFAPVSWIFSQSTTSIPFIGFIHICFYLISIFFAFKLLWQALQTVSGQKSTFIVIWMVIFILVSFQMSTSLRPIIGSSDHFLPTGKKFFLTHWVEAASVSNAQSR